MDSEKSGVGITILCALLHVSTYIKGDSPSPPPPPPPQVMLKGMRDINVGWASGRVCRLGVVLGVNGFRLATVNLQVGDWSGKIRPSSLFLGMCYQSFSRIGWSRSSSGRVRCNRTCHRAMQQLTLIVSSPSKDAGSDFPVTEYVRAQDET